VIVNDSIAHCWTRSYW